MNDKKLVIVILFIFLGLVIMGYFILKPTLTEFSSLSEEKCIDLGDDCWHSLAHQTFDRKYCNKIKDNETKEHCFEHIPEKDANAEENMSGKIKEFNIEAKKFSFEPDVIEVDKGDLVRINIKSIDISHGIAIPDFNINKRLEPGKSINIEFIADKSGEFNFFCNVYCGIGHENMKGKLIVN